jgi:hypothetical protein
MSSGGFYPTVPLLGGAVDCSSLSAALDCESSALGKHDRSSGL